MPTEVRKMPQDQDNLLMQLLLGGNQPDPTAQFLAQTFLAGRVPGDQGAAYQNVLTNLSPSVIAERRRLGPGMGEGLGMGEEDAGQAISQMLGLKLSAGQRQEQRMDIMNLLQERLIQQQEFGQKGEEIETKKKEADTRAKAETRRKTASEARNTLTAGMLANYTSLVAQRDQAQKIRQAAMDGVLDDGTELTPEQIRRYRMLAGMHLTDANILRTAVALLGTGRPEDRERAAALIQQESGMDMSGVADPATGIEAMINYAKRSFDWDDMGNDVPSAPPAGQAPTGSDLQDQFDQMQQGMDMQIQEMIEYYQDLDRQRQ